MGKMETGKRRGQWHCFGTHEGGMRARNEVGQPLRVEQTQRDGAEDGDCGDELHACRRLAQAFVLTLTPLLASRLCDFAKTKSNKYLLT